MKFTLTLFIFLSIYYSLASAKIRDNSIKPILQNNKSSADNVENWLAKKTFFIIAGTQKSGTTVLAAYISQHPNISFANKKELHYFDKKSTYLKGLKYYLSKFDRKKALSKGLKIFGEATPYYLASRDACSRIALSFPNVRMIILFRDPIERAYSEYQMKYRRVTLQGSFISLVSSSIADVLKCILLYPDSLDEIKSCLPNQISTHSRISKFMGALRSSMQKWNDWMKVVNSCFSFQCYGGGKPKSSSCAMGNFDKSIHFNSSSDREIRSLYHSIFNSEGQTIISFKAQSCWVNYKSGYETVLGVDRAMVGELNDFLTCAGPFIERDRSNISYWDEAVTNCLKVKSSGISSHYFYRSMYAVQLYHCFKYIDKKQFLILPSEKLRSDPLDVMKMVESFLGLPISKEQNQLEATLGHISTAPEEINDLISRKFKDFETTTSWRLNSEYEPLDTKIVTRLQSFYDLQNSLLIDLLGYDYRNI